jgi:BMFP domain-containing protein YqiC
MTKFEAWATKVWRATGKRLPNEAAEAIRAPAKRALRKLGLVSRPGAGT